MFSNDPIPLHRTIGRQRLSIFSMSLLLFLTSCAGTVTSPDTGKPQLSAADAKTRYQQGLIHYRESKFDASLAELTAANGSQRLKSADFINATKHIAFIHCVSNRQALCREQFQIVLKEDPDFNLAPNEIGHPAWGPVWLSAKGAVADQRAVARGGEFLATKSQQMLAEGIKKYEAGRYAEALNSLQIALENGFPDSPREEIRTRKYSAFSFCLLQRTLLCRAEFRAIFQLDPSFKLLPSEASHPAWATAYRFEALNRSKFRADGLKSKESQ
jgi:hypothetical protein